MLVRALCLALVLSLPIQARAAEYVVQRGDTLGIIANRFHMSVSALALANGIANINLIRLGERLLIPVPRHYFWYRVHWGDTLSGIALRHGLNVSTIRSLNPRLGVYPLAGQLLRLCGPCSSGSTYSTGSYQPARSQSTASGTAYVVRPGDTLIAVASHYGVSTSALLSANRLSNPNRIVIGSRLIIPRTWAAPYDPWQARGLIATYARSYNIEPALPLAVAWQESGFNQNMISRTGAVGVMQVEPYTGSHISALLGRSFNLYNIDDNVHAGVYWLSTLVAYYGGDERMAVAAYYQGTKGIARHGLFRDTQQYVANVMSLKSSFGG
ncbi:MAG TPA: LysM peptidoglycan-binding domain-containing protein [Chloroflexota bacterium]